MKRQLIKDVLESSPVGAEVVAGGWVRTRRDSKGGFSFVIINDGSCASNLQIVASNALENYESAVKRLTTGSSVIVRGTLCESKGRQQAVEVQAKEVRVLGFSDPETYPLQKKRISFERLRQIAHLRPRSSTFGAVTRVRDALAFATHKYFRENNFYYLHSPIITASDCEGAGEMFQVTTFDLGKVPKTDGEVDFDGDFFGKEAGLTVSGQLEAEAYACALGRVYTFGPTFRAENSNTRRHLAEFWMIEPEMAFADLKDDVDLAEEYVKYLCRYVLDNCEEDLAFLAEKVEESLVDTLRMVAESEFERISYAEAVKLLEKAPVKWEHPVGWGADLQSEHERYLVEEKIKRPVVVVDYPREIKPFYMRVNDGGKTVAALDVLFPKVGEIIGGSQREERLEVLTERIGETGLDSADYWWYKDLRRFGSVPHAGFGLGFERMVQFSSGMANIRDVIPFPRTPGNVEF